MKKTNRKVDEVARQEISTILLLEVSDPRLQFVTITGCKVSFDRAYADVYYTTSQGKYEEVAAALEKAKGFIRTSMAKKLDWKKSPLLRFHLDETIDHAGLIDDCISTERERFGEDGAQEESEE